MNLGTECSEFDLGLTFNNYKSAISLAQAEHVLKFEKNKTALLSILMFVPTCISILHVLKLTCLSPL